ncbi:MAG: diaminopimelate decarboxylase [Spirochaetia bacterium]|nr:diaminopimelate decarboxylase [Spirochaetia bacterium]
MEIENLRFLTKEQALELESQFGTPIFVYSQKEIEKRADTALAFPHAYGITVRYAMKANPGSTILKILRKKGIKIDASSYYEVKRALGAGFKAGDILLTSQELPSIDQLKEVVLGGTEFNACSLNQLEFYGKLFPTKTVSIRFNPGLGSGGMTKTNVGGNTSSFGIWFEYIEDVKNILKKYDLKVKRVHTHIGSGSDPEVWKAVARYTLEYAEIFPEAEIVNLGGGYKVGRMLDEKSTDFQKIGEPVRQQFIEFFEKHGRKLHFEIEPGTSLVANTGSILCKIMDKVSTGEKGNTFLKLNTGMDTNTRPSLYGSRHPLIVVQKSKKSNSSIKEFVVVGHCCESGDLFTQEFGGEISKRKLEDCEIDDLMVMEGTGAYCSGMSTKNYNSFPESAEVLIANDGSFHLIRKRQELSQIYQNELDVESIL